MRMVATGPPPRPGPPRGSGGRRSGGQTDPDRVWAVRGETRSPVGLPRCSQDGRTARTARSAVRTPDRGSEVRAMRHAKRPRKGGPRTTRRSRPRPSGQEPPERTKRSRGMAPHCPRRGLGGGNRSVIRASGHRGAWLCRGSRPVAGGVVSPPASPRTRRLCAESHKLTPEGSTRCPATPAHSASARTGSTIWQARWRPPGDPSDRGRIEKVFRTRALADAWLKKMDTDAYAGQAIDPRRGDRPFREVADAWRASWIGLEPKTRAGYESILTHHLIPEFGSKKAREHHAGSHRAARRKSSRGREQRRGPSAGSTPRCEQP